MPLLTDKSLAAHLGSGFTPRTIATLRRSRKIPYIKIGYRTLRYDLDKVLAALAQREVKAISSEPLR